MPTADDLLAPYRERLATYQAVVVRYSRGVTHFIHMQRPAGALTPVQAEMCQRASDMHRELAGLVQDWAPEAAIEHMRRCHALVSPREEIAAVDQPDFL